MCMRCLGTPANFKWLGEIIYTGLQVELAVCSCWQISAQASELPAEASVLPVTLCSELAVGFSGTAAATSGTIG